MRKTKFIMSVLLFLAVIFLAQVKSFALNFTDFTNAIALNNYDIDLTAYDNPLIWMGDIGSIASSGTIRGTSVAGSMSKLSGNALSYQGFNADNKKVYFSGNIGFDEYSTAIHVNNSGQANFNNSSVTFNANVVNNAGGAIQVNSGGQVNFSSSSVIFNANTAYSAFISSGGAISAINNGQINFTTSSVTFNANSASRSGGAINLDSNGKISFSSSSVRFISNSALLFGAVFAMDGQISFNNSSAVFNANTSGVGAIVASTAQINFNSSSVAFNANMGYIAGAVYVAQNGQINFSSSNVTFYANRPPSTFDPMNSRSGAVWVAYDGQVNFNNSSVTFNANTGQRGGAVFAGDIVSAVTNEQINFNNSSVVFNANSARSFGGGIAVNNSGQVNFKRSNVIFNANSADYGGAVYAQDAGQINFSSSSVIFNANRGSGAVYVSGGQVNFSNSSVTFNANLAGGAVFADGQVNFNNSSVTFNANSTNYRGGGAVYVSNGGQINFSNSNVEFNANTADVSGGGAIYAPSRGSVTISNPHFKYNKATGEGGAIYIGAESSITLKAINRDIEFIGNKANNLPNDIYLNNYDSALELNASASRTITMDGGITGGHYNAFITKTGDGDLIFKGNAIVNYQGNFNVEAGKMKINIPAVTISSLVVQASAMLSFVNNSATVFSQHKLFVGSATISGIFNIGLDISLLNPASPVNTAADMLISTGAITINAGSSITVSKIFNSSLWNAALSGSSVTIMRSDVSIDGWNFLWFDSRYYQLSGSADNKSLFLSVLSLDAAPTEPTPPPTDPGDPDPAPAPGPGEGPNPDSPSIKIIKANEFLVNALSLAAKMRGLDDIYNRMEQGATEQKGNAWVGLYGGGKTADEFSVNSIGGAFGVDVYESKNFMGGLFVRYGSNDIKEKDNKGAMGEIEFGIYGGLFEIKNSPINVKANLSIGIESYSMEAGENVDFDGKAFKGGFEIEYVSPISKTTKLKPFIGVQGGMASNDDIKTNDATIKSDSLLRAETKAGIGISGVLGATQNFKWYSRLYGIFLVSGNEPKYKCKDSGGTETEIMGAKEDSIQGAISLGGEYAVGKAVSIFVNAGADFGTGFGWTSGLGANYKF